MLGPRIRNLKIVSFMTSAAGLCVQPMLLQKAMEAGSSIAATIGVCTITGFFTFVTPILIHLVTRKYVTSLEYNEKKDEYIATIISFFLKPKQASIFYNNMTNDTFCIKRMLHQHLPSISVICILNEKPFLEVPILNAYVIFNLVTNMICIYY